jgi:hypothetical protein
MKLPVITVLALLAASCTAPGEPPAHPSKADYNDLMRRETDKAQSSIATIRLILRDASYGKIPRNYAIVSIRQAAADLTGITTDLAQIAAPAAKANSQRRLQRILLQATQTINRLADDWFNPGARKHAAQDLATTAKRTQALNNDLA